MSKRKGLARKIIAMSIAFLMIFQAGLGSGAVYAADRAAGSYDMSKGITSASIQTKVDGEWCDIAKTVSAYAEEDDSVIEVAKNAEVRVNITYQPELLLDNPADKFVVGDRITYDIPAGIALTREQNGDVYDGPTIVGDYKISTDGNIVITLTNEKYLQNSNGKLKNGTVSFDGRFIGDAWGIGGEKEIVFGGVTLKVKFEKDQIATKANLYVLKEIIGNGIDYKDKNNAYIEYRIVAFTPGDNTEIIKNVTVEDVFTKGSDYVGDIYDVQVSKGTFDTSTKVWSGIGDMDKNQSHTLTFKVKVNSSIFDEAAYEGSRIIENTANIYSNGEWKDKHVVSTEENSAINIEKSNSGYHYDETTNTSTVTYKVKVSADANNTWPINDVTVWDAFGDNKNYVIDYKTVSKPTGTTATSYKDDKKLFWNIGTMYPGDVKELTYTVEIDDNIFLDGNVGITSRTLKNTATYYVDGTQKDHDDSSVEFRKVWIWKNGVQDGNGKIKFVIHANESTSGAPILTGPLNFRDNLEGDWVYEGDVVVKWYNQGPDNKGNVIGQETFNVDGKTSWTWSKDAANGYYYEFEYYARYTGNQVGTPSIKNSAGIGIGIGGTTYNHYTEWTGTGHDFNSMTKHFVSRNNNIATWQSKITTNIPAGATYTDSRSGGEWTFTDEQIKAIKVGGAGEGKNVKIEKTGNSEFKITFNEEIEASSTNPITIDYSCTLRTDNVAAGTTKTYKNKGKLQVGSLYDTSEASCTYTQEQRIKKEAGSYDANNGILTWNITVNGTGSLKDKATIIDEIPDGLEYVDATIISEGSSAKNKTSLQKSVSGQTVTMELTGLQQTFNNKAYVKIELKTKVVDKAFLLGNGSKTFNNEATLNYNGQGTTSKAQKTIENESLKKEGLYNDDTAPNIEYTITVNPNGLDMLENSDTIRIEDTMSTNMMLLSDTLKIVDGDGNSVTPVKMKVEGNTFSFDVPDDRTLTITYKAYVTGEVGSEQPVSNKVTYSGQAEIPGDEISNKIEVAKSRASIEGAVGFYIVKKDAYDIKKTLQGTQFTLYKVDEDGDLVETSVKTAGEDGVISFVGLDETAVYAYNETAAAANYLIGSNSVPTYIAFNEDAIAGVQLPEDVEVQIIQSGIVLEKQNELNTTTRIRFDGTKILENANYDLEAGTYDFVITGPNIVKETADGETIVDSLTVSHDNDGKILFPEIEYKLSDLYEAAESKGEEKKEDINSEEYEYTIIEKQVEDEAKIPGIEYSDDVYKVIVTVTKDDTKGTIGAEVTSVTKNGTAVPKDDIKFVNTYDADDETTTVEGVKETVGMALEANAFKFELIETTAGVADEDRYEVTALNDADGKFTFQLPTYTLEDHNKVFNYEIREVAGSQEGITYDPTLYKVAVHVTDNKAGKIELEKFIFKVDGQQETRVDKEVPITFVNHFEGSVELTKTNGKEGEAYETLSDAVFALYKVNAYGDDELIGEYTTGNDGVLTVEELEEGSYYFVETDAPDGYSILTDEDGNPAKYEFKIGPDAEEADVVAEVNVANEQKLGKLSLIKKDAETSALIAGATFTLYKDGEVYIDPLTTDEEGMIEVDELPWGEYYFVEVSAPEGYIVDKTPTDVITINADYVEGEPVTIEKTNKFEGSVTLTKTNGKEGEAYETLEGAVFALYKENTDGGYDLIDEYTTGDDGVLTVEELAEGSYYFVETKAPAGYSIVTGEDGEPLKYEFKIGPNGGDEAVDRNIVVNNEQKLGTLVLDKADVDTEAPVKGAEFALYKDGNLYQDKLFTDENGEIKVESLPWGEYYFVEVSAPEGYIVDKTPTDTIAINAEYVDGEVTTVEKTNKFLGSVELTKTNGKDGEAYETLEGAVFALYKENAYDGYDLIGEYTTGDDGVISVDELAQGEYYFVETVAPAGYSILTDADGEAVKYEFEIGPNGGDAEVAAEVEVANEQKLGKLTLIKKDVDSSELIAGTTFTLYKDGEPYAEELVTDADGKIEVEELPWGEYYFVETVPAPGYIADPTPTKTITIDAEYVDGEPETIDKTNEQTAVYISKTDITGETPVEGAVLEIYRIINTDANLEALTEDNLEFVTEWTSDETAQLIQGELIVGESYVLRETIAPTGFGFIKSDIVFTLAADGTITSDAPIAVGEDGNQVLLVQDDIIDLTVSKTCFETGKNLEGATLAVYDKETGNKVVKWVSTEEGNFDFGQYLNADNTYVLKELEAPNGYVKIDDVEFAVDKEGKVELITKSRYVKLKDGHMEVANCPEEEPKTGDDFSSGAAMLALMLGMFGIAATAIPRRKRQ